VKAKLTYESGPWKGKGKSFESERITVGRALDNDLITPSDISLVSRRQAEVFFHDDRFWVQDCGSKHGTFVNGQQVTVMQMLASGDVIRFGQTGPTVRFELKE